MPIETYYEGTMTIAPIGSDGSVGAAASMEDHATSASLRVYTEAGDATAAGTTGHESSIGLTMYEYSWTVLRSQQADGSMATLGLIGGNTDDSVFSRVAKRYQVKISDKVGDPVATIQVIANQLTAVNTDVSMQDASRMSLSWPVSGPGSQATA